MLKILIILKLNNVSYRGAASFFMDNLEYMDLLGIKILPSFQTLSRRAKELPLEEINESITEVFLDIEDLRRENAVGDSFCGKEKHQRLKDEENMKMTKGCLVGKFITH
ncbi:MAG: transposase [Candidatus Micrarchaeaceae archaeon]